MKAQTPAQGVLKVNDWGPSKMYQVVCDCGHEDCTHIVDIEADDARVNVTIYAKVKLGWGKTRWYHIWQLLTKGYADFDTTIVLEKQVALNYAEMLKSAVQDVEEFRNKK